MSEQVHVPSRFSSLVLWTPQEAEDTYGGWGAHGGGAFSGKDPTKVDRSAAYICRQMAKSVVKSGLCKRALVQLSYAIGVAKPLSLFVETYGTEQGALTVSREIERDASIMKQIRKAREERELVSKSRKKKGGKDEE